ncbi:hypothetical protein NQZ68_003391, partial [Dissostichus eleginoides]
TETERETDLKPTKSNIMHRWSAPHLTRSPPGPPPCTISHGPLCYHPERDRKETTVQNLICSVQLRLAAIWLHGTAWHFDDA